MELAAKDPLLPTDRTHDRLGLATGAASAVPVRCDVTIHAAAGLPQPNGVPPLRLETVTIENVAMQIQADKRCLLPSWPDSSRYQSASRRKRSSRR